MNSDKCLEQSVIDSLKSVGYDNSLLKKSLDKPVIDNNNISIELMSAVQWNVNQLCDILGIASGFTLSHNENDVNRLKDELSAFLSNYGCPLSSLTGDSFHSNIDNRQHQMELLNYLITELQAVHITAVYSQNERTVSAMDIDVDEEDSSSQLSECNVTQQAADMIGTVKETMTLLSIKDFPDGDSIKPLFTKMEERVKKRLDVWKNPIGKPLLKTTARESDWPLIEQISESMNTDYKTRRDMILVRLRVTIDAFKTSPNLQKKKSVLAAISEPAIQKISDSHEHGIISLLTARDDLLRVYKASSALAREVTQCSVNSVRIGKVPNRGGRPWEYDIPPPEMPAFGQRNTQNAGRGRGFSGGRGGRSDGYGKDSRHDNRHYSGGYDHHAKRGRY